MTRHKEAEEFVRRMIAAAQAAQEQAAPATPEPKAEPAPVVKVKPIRKNKVRTK